ncbi:CRISPR-associated endonuclease Cas2 [Candidatus Haliotispira prima]|uniref:CRISPR-associated endoribonuclease Cas2 n=1 Tax=Candidatus Haliotispira prima TaxID=3034016 RepID=A0ABY8MJL9_9SPIO|nr:CRISPR-associated endonuclease Cas2 [Candidatus Haliotispira prima]
MNTLGYKQLNHYKIMWLFVNFDLPVVAPEERGAATRFRNFLLEDGFTMHQYSVYIRHCPSKQVARQHVKRIRLAVPARGHVSILQVTDLQYSEIINIWGSRPKALKTAPKQLELF